MSISRGGEELPTVSVVDSLTGQFATWSSASECDPRTQASIPPFMRNYKSQVYDPLSSQLSCGSEIESNVETQTAYSNHAQPGTSILSQLPEQHMVYSQEVKSNTMDKKGERGILEEHCLLQTLEGHPGGVCAVAFSPDGKLLASGGSGYDDGSIKLWDASSGAPRQTLERHPGGVSAVAFSPDGKLLASGGYDYDGSV